VPCVSSPEKAISEQSWYGRKAASVEQPQPLPDSQGASDHAGNKQPSAAHPLMSKKVSDHLANERTFLAWVRTGITIVAFGFVIERFGLLLRELGLKVGLSPNSAFPSSKWLGIVVAILGIMMLIVALFHFVQVQRTIDEERYKPSLLFPIVVTSIASLIGLFLAIYLTITP
jgi:putative membrane protein